LLVQLRLQINGAHWKEAVDTASLLRTQNPKEEEASAATRFRADALRAWAQQLLDAQQIGPLLPYLDPEGVACLAPEQRTALVRRLALGGLPGAAKVLLDLSPTKEQPTLRKVALEAMASGTNPGDALALLPGKGEGGFESLRRAQALVALKRWPEAKGALPKATPGPERMKTLLAYLRRPAEYGQDKSSRRAEAEAWLVRSPEKGTDREPLTILVADLRAQAADWRGALALYPTAPLPEHRGWVALMRASCQLKLGQKDTARATLKAAVDEPGFKMERQSLAKQLGM
jgi:hypothetical protein